MAMAISIISRWWKPMNGRNRCMRTASRTCVALLELDPDFAMVSGCALSALEAVLRRRPKGRYECGDQLRLIESFFFLEREVFAWNEKAGRTVGSGWFVVSFVAQRSKRGSPVRIRRPLRGIGGVEDEA